MECIVNEQHSFWKQTKISSFFVPHHPDLLAIRADNPGTEDPTLGLIGAVRVAFNTSFNFN